MERYHLLVTTSILLADFAIEFFHALVRVKGSVMEAITATFLYDCHGQRSFCQTIVFYPAQGKLRPDCRAPSLNSAVTVL
jgi:hypothetical protein